MSRKPLKLYVDINLQDWLKQEAVKRYSSVSQLVRDLIVEARANGREETKKIGEDK